MTPSEAHLFLNTEAFEDLQDAYDHSLFDQKQFFLIKPCIPKVYRSKIQKIDRLLEAARVLGIEKPSSHQLNLVVPNSEQKTILEHYRKHMDYLNSLKREVSFSQTLEELKLLFSSRLDFFHSYASRWPFFSEYKEDVKLGVEVDPMAFFQELQELEQLGITTFVNLFDSDRSVGILVKKESTRLHCLHNSN